IVVHTVFAGGKGGPVPELDVAGRVTGYKTDSAGNPVVSRPDPGFLRKLAAETGGTFSTVSAGRTDLEGVAKELELGARRPMSEVMLTHLEERFQIPLAVAVGALGLLLLGAGDRLRGTGQARERKAASSVAAILLLFVSPGALSAQISGPVQPQA